MGIIARPTDFIFNSGSVLIGTSPTACLFVGTREYGFITYYARLFFSTCDPVTATTAIHPTLIVFNLYRSSIDGLATNQALAVRFSYILTHSTSIPLKSIPYGLRQHRTAV